MLLEFFKFISSTRNYHLSQHFRGMYLFHVKWGCWYNSDAYHCLNLSGKLFGENAHSPTCPDAEGNLRHADFFNIRNLDILMRTLADQSYFEFERLQTSFPVLLRPQKVDLNSETWLLRRGLLLYQGIRSWESVNFSSNEQGLVKKLMK